MNWIDFLIGSSFLVPFAMGIAGCGILSVAQRLLIAGVAATCGYLFLEFEPPWEFGQNLMPESPAVRWVVLSITVFVSLLILARLAGRLFGGASLFRLVDALVGGFVCALICLLIIGGASRVFEQVNTAESHLFNRIEELKKDINGKYRKRGKNDRGAEKRKAPGGRLL